MSTPFEAHDAAFHRLIPADGTIERIAGGFSFTEGPVWRDGALLFSDIPASRTVRWRQLPEGPEVTTAYASTGKANGLTLNAEGRLIRCEHQGRLVSRMVDDGTATTLADRYQAKRLNSPNDVVVKSDGSIYFTDPPAGLGAVMPDLVPRGIAVAGAEKELPFQGVYRLDTGGQLTLLVDDFELPNGLAFSPDEERLYIDDSLRRHVRIFDVQPDGALANGRIFADMQSPDAGGPDGMKADVEGNLYCTGPGGTWVYTPEGTLLGRIITPEQPANLAFGDSDWQTLFLTAQTSVYRVRVAVPGMPVGPPA
ncbi:MAG: gluconolactonase [Dehalococcoidia bacterium]|nr:gluconolactonase [Dehalococcoidia bacterium]